MAGQAESNESPSAPRRRTFLGWLADFVVEWKVGLLVLAILITAIALPVSMKIELDESIESFFSPEEPLLQAYQKSRAAFGGDEFVLVAYPRENVAGADSLKEIEAFSKQLSAIPGVNPQSTQDLASTLRAATSQVLEVLPRLMRLPARRAIRERLISFSQNLLIGGDDENVTAIVLRLLPEAEAPVSRKKTFEAIQELAARHDPPAYVAGEPIQVHEMFRYVEHDGRILGLASSALMVIAILMMFRSLRWVILPLIVVHMTLIWTKAILFLAGMKLSMVSSMLTSLLTIIGVATVVHIVVLFRDWRREMEADRAFVVTFKSAILPVFWVTITTVIGFVALLSSDITPIRSFAWMMSIGTSLLLVALPMVLPAGVLLGPEIKESGFSTFEQRIAKTLDSVTDITSAHRFATIFLATVICGIAVYGCLKQRIETDFSKNFRESSPVVKSIRFFETGLGGVGSWEVNFEAPENLTTEYVEKVRGLTEALRGVKTSDGTHLTKVVSMTDGLDLIPALIAEDWIVKRHWLKDLQPEFEPSLYNSDLKRMRIVLRAQEQQPAETKLELIRLVETEARKVFPDAHATGLYVLLANLINSILGDQLISGVGAALGMVVCMLLAFRNLKVAIISLLPNLLPILVVVGIIGWLDIPVNIGVAMVASVSLGLTVDSSILYFTDYLRARKAGASHELAIHETHGGAALAMVLSSIALIAGFAVLTVSEFIPLAFFGAMVSVAMLGGLIGNLVLLPVMLKWLPDDMRVIPKSRERKQELPAPQEEAPTSA